MRCVNTVHQQTVRGVLRTAQLYTSVCFVVSVPLFAMWSRLFMSVCRSQMFVNMRCRIHSLYKRARVVCFHAAELSRSLSCIASDCHLPNRTTSRTPMILVCFFKKARCRPQWLNCPFRQPVFSMFGHQFHRTRFCPHANLDSSVANHFELFYALRGGRNDEEKKFTLGSICFGAAKFT